MDATKRETIVAGLQNIVGSRHVLTDPALFAGALVEPRKLYKGQALALVRPGSTKEVADVAAFCNEARIAMVPQGGNTGLVGGQTPDKSGEEIIISTQRLRAIREVDIDSNVMICESGVTLGEAQTAALAADRLFPLSLASEGTCTIGGNISTNAGGLNVIAYGNTRDLVTGVEAVLADGRIVNALQQAAQGQHRLRCEEPFHRRRRNARHHHGRLAPALSQSARAGDGLRRFEEP